VQRAERMLNLSLAVLGGASRATQRPPASLSFVLFHTERVTYELVRRTFFAQFCGGERREDTSATMARLGKQGVSFSGWVLWAAPLTPAMCGVCSEQIFTILDYAAENDALTASSQKSQSIEEEVGAWCHVPSRVSDAPAAAQSVRLFPRSAHTQY
jgi:hypothetical protein